MHVLLMGNPNSGKSVVFSRLTGVNVISSNYPGTTVEFTRGVMRLGEEYAEVLDVPGTYTLSPTSKAEEVALRILEDHLKEEGEGQTIVVNIVDATNLERSLNLTLQLIQKKVPMVVCLNMWDETKHIGVYINHEKLEEILGVPCIPTCAITGEGIKNLVERIKDAKVSGFTFDEDNRWNELGKILNSVQRIEHKHHTLLETLGDASVNPPTAIPIALLVLAASFLLVRFIGENLISHVFDPLFRDFWSPVVFRVSGYFQDLPFLHDILFGEIKGLDINYGSSLGLLTTGVYIPLAAVLPYIVAFYFVLSVLEDTGYLPRLAVLLDTLMHKLGMHGMAIVPMLLGLGCNVPGALAARILETKRERFIASTVMAITVPCMAQLAMIAGLSGSLGDQGMGSTGVFLSVAVTLVVTAITLGIIFNRVMKGESTELLIDIPPYRVPYIPALVKKLWMRVKWFLKEAVPWVLFGVFLVNLMYNLGILHFAGKAASPLVVNILGLPREAIGGLVIGFLRKDVAVGMLAPLGMDWKQVAVASTVLVMYFPCVATFSVLLKEFGFKYMLKAAFIMLVTAFTAGGILNLVLHLL